MTQPQNLRIRKADPINARGCALIHQQEIPTGFLSQLGIPFLKLLYTAMIRSRKVICLVVADESDQVVGFVCGCSHVGKFYKEFFAKHGLKALLILLPKLLEPAVFRKVIETVKYEGNGDASELPQAELLAIAVRPHVRGIAVAQKLTEALFNECQEREIQNIKVVVGAGNIRANRFYEKVGFELHSNTSVHESEVSNVYVKALG